MNKFKKVTIGIGIFINGIVSKVFATSIDMTMPISMYAVDPGPRKTIGETISKIGKITVPVILFVIGLFVILSKKITKKVKAITISVLILLGILGWFIMNFIAEL